MEEYARSLHLDKSLSGVLNRVRRTKGTDLFLDLDPEPAVSAVNDVIKPLLVKAGLTEKLITQYGWFGRDLARELRVRVSGDLAFHVERLVRKWILLGLNENILQVLVCEVFIRLSLLQPARPKSEHSTKPGPEVQHETP
jgi:hypothetical protein